MRISVNAADVVEGEPKQLCIPGRGPIAIYNVGDSYFATDDTCTHGDASLADGFQDGFVIECPFHAGTFDVRTGKALSSPATEEVRSYPVTLEDGALVVHLDGNTVSADAEATGQ